MPRHSFFFISIFTLLLVLSSCGVEGDPIPPDSDELPIVQRYVRDLTPEEVLKHSEEQAAKAAQDNEKKKKTKK